MDASRMKPGLDPRMLGVGVGDYGGMDQLFQPASRSSQCTTPSFDGNYSLVGGLGNDKPVFRAMSYTVKYHSFRRSP